LSYNLAGYILYNGDITKIDTQGKDRALLRRQFYNIDCLCGFFSEKKETKKLVDIARVGLSQQFAIYDVAENLTQ
jgi:hypothetical protein